MLLPEGGLYRDVVGLLPMSPIAKGHPQVVFDLVVGSLCCPAIRNSSSFSVFQDADFFERHRSVVLWKVPLPGSPVLPHEWFQVLHWVWNPTEQSSYFSLPGDLDLFTSGDRNSDRLMKVLPASFAGWLLSSPLVINKYLVEIKIFLLLRLYPQV